MRIPSIPYKGSKRSISKELIEFMISSNPDAEYFYDVFGGGGAMAMAAAMSGKFKAVYYNELDTRIFNLFHFLTNEKVSKSWYRWICREEFHETVKSNDNSVEAGMIATCWSFGNDCKSYLFSPKNEKIKKLCWHIVVDQCLESSEILFKDYGIKINTSDEQLVYDRYLKSYKVQIKENKIRCDLQSLERLQSLQNLQNLDNAKTPIICYNQSYDEIVFKKNSIIYCDPPYQNTGKYRLPFDQKKFFDWFQIQGQAAFLSEYESPFNLVHTIKKRSLMSAKNNSTIKLENLYMNSLCQNQEQKNE